MPDLSAAAEAARAASTARRSLGRIALEGPIDASAYRVGPGDVFSISIGGPVPRQTEVVVSADGTLPVPEAGSFPVAGLSLREVQTTVGAALRQRYRNVPTDVTLASPREFYVHVSGDVPLPGRQLVNAMARVSDALELAAGGVSAQSLAAYGQLTTPTLSAEDEEEQQARRQQISVSNATVQQRARAERGEVWPDARRLPALRNVRVRHRDGTETLVDLARYFVTGAVAFNPVLSDGDAIHLPPFDPSREGVSVSGAVDRPGVYDVRPDDTVLDLLIAATGDDVFDRFQSVRLTRAGGTGGAVEVPVADAEALAVGPRDQIYAVAIDPDAGVAEAVGAVRFPGLYPITAGVTTLGDLIEMAGGLRADAFPRGAYLERRARSLPAALSGNEAPLSDLSLFGRQFITTELARTPRQPVDLSAARSGVALIDGDRLVVPRDLGGVRVFGQVSEQRYVPFVPGEAASYYVDAAGGAGPSATEVYVLEAGSGRLIAGAGAEVREGDAVFVDRRPTGEDPTLAQLALQEERAEREASRDRRQLLIQTLATTVSAISTLIFAYSVIRTN